MKNTNTLVNNQALQGFVARALYGTAETQRIEDLEAKQKAEASAPREAAGE